MKTIFARWRTRIHLLRERNELNPQSPKGFQRAKQVRDTRRFVESRLAHLQTLFGAEAVMIRAEIAKHVQKITLTPEGRTYVASGTWDLLSVAAWMVPGAWHGPNVDPIDSNV